MIQLEDTVYFECPYCNKPHNLTQLLAAREVTQYTSIFLCYRRDRNEKEEGCNKEFVLDLTSSYEISIRVIEGERERDFIE